MKFIYHPTVLYPLAMKKVFYAIFIQNFFSTQKYINIHILSREIPFKLEQCEKIIQGFGNGLKNR